MSTSTYTITTDMGAYTGTLREVIAWQAAYRGGHAKIESTQCGLTAAARVDDIDFSDEDAAQAILDRLLGAE